MDSISVSSVSFGGDDARKRFASEAPRRNNFGRSLSEALVQALRADPGLASRSAGIEKNSPSGADRFVGNEMKQDISWGSSQGGVPCLGTEAPLESPKAQSPFSLSPIRSPAHTNSSTPSRGTPASTPRRMQAPKAEHHRSFIGKGSSPNTPPRVTSRAYPNVYIPWYKQSGNCVRMPYSDSHTALPSHIYTSIRMPSLQFCSGGYPKYQNSRLGSGVCLSCGLCETCRTTMREQALSRQLYHNPGNYLPLNSRFPTCSRTQWRLEDPALELIEQFIEDIRKRRKQRTI